MAVGEGAYQPRGDLRTVDRCRHDPQVMVEHGEIEACKVEELGHAGVGEKTFKPGRAVAAGRELNEMRVPIPSRKLHERIAGRDAG